MAPSEETFGTIFLTVRWGTPIGDLRNISSYVAILLAEFNPSIYWKCLNVKVSCSIIYFWWSLFLACGQMSDDSFGDLTAAIVAAAMSNYGIIIPKWFICLSRFINCTHQGVGGCLDKWQKQWELK